MTRLGLIIGIMTLAIIVTLAMSFYGINTALEGINHVYKGSVEEMQFLVSMRERLDDIEDVIYHVSTKKLSGSDGKKGIQFAQEQAQEEWVKYLKNAQGLKIAPSRQAIIDTIQAELKELSLFIAKVEEILSKENQEGLNEIIGTRNSILDRLAKEVLNLIQWHAIDSKEDYEKALIDIDKIEYYTVIVFIIALITAFIAAFWIALSIIRPLKTAVEAIERLTVGDDAVEITTHSNDEVGLLLKAMKSLSASSKKMSHQLLAVSGGDLTVEVQKRSDQDTLGIALATMVKNLKHIVGELKIEVNNLTTSSQEIVGSVSQVATGSAETAAAVAETTTSVEELKQTAHISNEKAKEVLQNAEHTMEIVNTSEKSLQTTIDDMEKINEKMHIISSGIVKLSEHSQTIREIIDTVNDLAEQSNLLAVNAAIEAAKAGEHGKSFAVVAGEIRTLAEQSKAATIQVRSILNDIQSSTSEAVLATEQGSKAVEKGVGQSAETSESMQKLTQSMTKVAQMADEIADSSGQQLIGVDQVTVAMSNISEAASQHVDNMKQIESAVFTLNSVGETLKQLISKYKTNND